MVNNIIISVNSSKRNNLQVRIIFNFIRIIRLHNKKMICIFIFNLNINSLGSSQEMQELRNMMAQLSQRLETLDNSHANLSGTVNDNHVERSLLPVLIRNKGRNRQLSPISRSYKKTLHVCYIF